MTQIEFINKILALSNNGEFSYRNYTISIWLSDESGGVTKDKLSNEIYYNQIDKNVIFKIEHTDVTTNKEITCYFYKQFLLDEFVELRDPETYYYKCFNDINAYLERVDKLNEFLS